MLILHYAPNTIALASIIALEEAGGAYRAVRLNFSDNEQQSAGYLRINPKGRVPALITGRGILTETPAILQYIALTHPGANLAPLDAFALAQVQSFNTYLCSTVHVAHAHGPRGARWADEQSSFDDMKRKVPRTVGDCFALMEQEMVEGPWVMGEAYSICDPYLFTLSQWLRADGVDPERFPKIADHSRRMAQRPAVQRALAVERAL